MEMVETMSNKPPEKNTLELSGANHGSTGEVPARKTGLRKKTRDSEAVSYYTQKEIAEFFRVSQGTVIKWRELGHLEYFRPPGSNRVLYPAAGIARFRETFTYREEVAKPPLEISSCRPVAPEKNWRI